MFLSDVFFDQTGRLIFFINLSSMSIKFCRYIFSIFLYEILNTKLLG